MKHVIRAQYRAIIRNGVTESEISLVTEECYRKLKTKVEKGILLTGTMNRYKNMLFLYVEYVVNAKGKENTKVEAMPDAWLENSFRILESWPGVSKKRYWVYMYPVFWFDQPKSIEQWRRKEKPTERCGRIAIVYSEKLLSYIYHHQAIVKEGLLVGDRYQMISQHENILFSYFECPRDRERVNISRLDLESEEIKKWEGAEPESHFIHLPESNGENFLIIQTVFSL